MSEEKFEESISNDESKANIDEAALEDQERSESGDEASKPDNEKKVDNSTTPSKPDDKQKKRISVPLGAYIISVVAFVLATLMLTYTVCSSIYQKQKAEMYAGIATETQQSQQVLSDWSEITVKNLRSPLRQLLSMRRPAKQ